MGGASNVVGDALGWTKQGSKAAIAVVVGTRRSAPRPIGTKMAIGGQGEISGAVSGGCVEGAVIVEAEQIMQGGMTVRDAESLVQRERNQDPNLVAPSAPGERGRAPTREPAGAAPAKDPNTLALERRLADILGLRVSIEERGEGGRLTVHYETLEQLDDVLHRILDRPLPPRGTAIEV